MVAPRGKYAPERGDVIWLQFTPQAGHEQGGRRPAVVLSPKSYNSKTGLALCCPITSPVKGYPFEVALPTGFAVEGVALCDQVKSLDWQARNATLLGTLPASSLNVILQKTLTLLR